MVRVFIGFCFLFMARGKAFSQNDNTEIPAPGVFFRFNFLGLADPLDQNISFGIERPFHPNWSAGTDAGWIFASHYIENARSCNGLILRPFIRYYPNDKKQGFYEAELHYKYVSYKIQDWLGREPVDNIPTYEEYTAFNMNKHAAGIHFKGGHQLNISRDARVQFEITAGLGIRFKWHKVSDGSFFTTFLPLGTLNTSQVNVNPVLPLSFRLLYKL